MLSSKTGIDFWINYNKNNIIDEEMHFENSESFIQKYHFYKSIKSFIKYIYIKDLI